ncbi:MAG: hypothetical protein M3P06_21290 [Acidobacteriota bacterium]|nr:hypothetical protein [Acidobacteriota bacterium]
MEACYPAKDHLSERNTQRTNPYRTVRKRSTSQSRPPCLLHHFSPSKHTYHLSDDFVFAGAIVIAGAVSGKNQRWFAIRDSEYRGVGYVVTVALLSVVKRASAQVAGLESTYLPEVALGL